jgi:hypothetical protein
MLESDQNLCRSLNRPNLKTLTEPNRTVVPFVPNVVTILSVLFSG